MRIIPFILSTLITIALVYALDNKWGGVPPLGRFLSPQQGFWQNAEPVDHNYNEQLNFAGLKGRATVYLDERLVPHVFAENDEDAFFIQGFLHAKFRLWQMEFQTFAAAGRLSEKIGNNPDVIRYDREQRRLGMAYGAEKSLALMESDPVTKSFLDSYTKGVNAYINTLSESAMPVEYKLLDYKPEPWTNLKIALFQQVMTKDLAGFERDLEFTNQKSVLSLADMNLLFPSISDSSKPIVPAGTTFDPPGIVPVKPADADSLYFGNDTTLNVIEYNKPNPNNGSNSWAVSGSRTANGAPILCNDPHLTLSFPSIWYEMQINTPSMNVYGASFPGAPGVIIGFNDHIAFGFTNSMRDVKDYFSIRYKDASRKEYWYNNKWEPTTFRIEEIKVARSTTIYDTVAYTAFGPVIYDESFTSNVSGNQAIAVRWIAHEPSNAGMMPIRLDHAKNYEDYLAAIKGFVAPGQNMLFASKTDTIAIWQQGKFPARWTGQGLYLMPGADSSYNWQGFIPENENPHIINPAEGFIQSANQKPVDSAYPYFIPGNYVLPRGRTIHRNLSAMENVTPQMMMGLQLNYFNCIAEYAVPMLLKYIDPSKTSDKQLDYLNRLKQWNFYSPAESVETTIYQTWIDSLKQVILADEFATIKKPMWPYEEAFVEMLLKDSASHLIDDKTTPEKETLADQVTKAFQLATGSLSAEESETGLLWWKHKKPYINHLLRSDVLPFGRQDLQVGGSTNTPNAITTNHGPSWRMVVQLSEPTVAYGIYPGGQSGNPGSRFYDTFINDWAAGKYYPLWVMKQDEAGDARVKWTMRFSNS